MTPPRHWLSLALIGALATAAHAEPSSTPANVHQIAYGRHLARTLDLSNATVRVLRAGADGMGLSAHVSAAAEAGFQIRTPSTASPAVPTGRGFSVRCSGLRMTRLRFKSSKAALVYAYYHADLGSSLGLLAVRARRVIVLSGERLKDPRFALRARRFVLRGLDARGARLDAFTGPWEVGFKASSSAAPLLPTLQRLQRLAKAGKIERQGRAAELSLTSSPQGWISTSADRTRFVRSYYSALVGDRTATPAAKTVERFEIRLKGAPKGLTRGGIRLSLAGKPYVLDMHLDKAAGFRKNNLTARYKKSFAAALKRGVPAAKIPSGFSNIEVDIRPNGDYVLVLENCPAGAYQVEGMVRQRGRLPAYFFKPVTIDAVGATSIHWNARSRAPRLAQSKTTLSF